MMAVYGQNGPYTVSLQLLRSKGPVKPEERSVALQDPQSVALVVIWGGAAANLNNNAQVTPVPSLDREVVNRLAIKALQSGARQHIASDGKTHFPHIEWDVSGNCLKPVVVEHIGRWSDRMAKYIVVGRGLAPSTLRVTMETRCRKCEACLVKRAAHWRYRARFEYAVAPRTWFGTMTFRPELHQRFIDQTRMHYIKNGLDWDALPETERFRTYERFAYQECKLFHKRLRKAGARYRFLQVAEKHQSGLVHYHVLIHEVSPDHPCKHKVLSENWSQGFSNFKLATEQRQVTYLLKYLTKSSDASIRASLRYGITLSKSSKEVFDDNASNNRTHVKPLTPSLLRMEKKD